MMSRIDSDIEKSLPVAIFKMLPQYRTNSKGLKNKSKATFEIEQC
jgi:hypothetical protein